MAKATRRDLQSWAAAGRAARAVMTACQNCGTAQTVGTSNVYDGDCAACYEARSTAGAREARRVVA